MALESHAHVLLKHLPGTKHPLPPARCWGLECQTSQGWLCPHSLRGRWDEMQDSLDKGCHIPGPWFFHLYDGERNSS